jgi:hypothetical protein
VSAGWHDSAGFANGGFETNRERARTQLGLHVQPGLERKLVELQCVFDARRYIDDLQRREAEVVEEIRIELQLAELARDMSKSTSCSEMCCGFTAAVPPRALRATPAAFEPLLGRIPTWYAGCFQRTSVRLAAVFSFALATLLAVPALAAEETSDSIPFAVGARVAFAAGASELHKLVGVYGRYEVLPRLSLGGLYEYTGWGSTAEYCEQCYSSVHALGAFAEVHPLPRFVIDPWLRGTLGVRFEEAAHWNLEPPPVQADPFVEGRGGVDLALPHVAFGPDFALGTPIGPSRAFGSLGVHLEFRWF